MTTPSTRFRVLERDGFRCRYCGQSADDGAVLHVDHIHPRAHGGSDDMDNLVTACSLCNIGKSARLLGVTEQPVVFRGRTKAKKRSRRYKTVPPVIEEPWEIGSHCCTPLMVAVLGVHYGKRSYRDTWKYLTWLGAGILPPHRMADEGWFRYLKSDEPYFLEVSRGLIEVLEPVAA